ncbi:hypothetical protein [Paenibacillus sp. IHBB 10380]|nr:hypothetical protein [Paenibacillus sp. IHBB 10380]
MTAVNHGRARTVFDTVKEERDSLKVQIDLLKKAVSKAIVTMSNSC